MPNSNILSQQKNPHMGHNIAEQWVNNNNKAKAKQQTQEPLSSPLSKFPNTYHFGNFENCELNVDNTLIYPHLHSLMYHVCRNPHRGASPFL